MTGSSQFDSHPLATGEQVAALRIAVAMGGSTDEREISLKTGAAVSAALRTLNHEVLDVEIQSDGLTWKCKGDEGSPLGLIAGALAEVDVYFIALHGGGGEGGVLQGFFQSLDLDHTGSGVQASALCMDKLQSLRMLRHEGIRIPPGICLSSEDFTCAPDERLETLRSMPGAENGLSVKPRCGGSSIATQVLDSKQAAGAALDAALAAVFAVGDQALVESRIVGIEVTCPILEDKDGIPRPLLPVEICPKDGNFFDYEEKYNASGAQEFCPPRKLNPSQIELIQRLALKAHLASGCSGYSRVDFIVPIDEKDQTPVFLEVNTLPGMTERSLFPLSAKTTGITFPKLCESICLSALRK